MKCPLDKNDMIVVEHKKIELDYCLTCTGVWFDCGELDLLLESSHSPEGKSCNDMVKQDEAQVTEAKRKCPICGQKMDKVWIGQDPRVIVDSCPTGDGLWFDGGELHQVLSQFKGKPGAGDVIAFLSESFLADQKPGKTESEK